MTVPTVLVDGRPATAEDLATPALLNYGHYTTMQVRGGAVRGLSKHFSRLTMQHAELFDSALDLDQVHGWMRAAVAEQPDAQLRVNVFETPAGEVRVMISLRPPSEADAQPLSLLPVDYARPVAHIKHVGGFGQSYFARRARLQGFDDALLVTPAGLVAETSIANVGFIARPGNEDGDGTTSVIWPDAPVLHGTTWQLLDEALLAAGQSATRAPVPLKAVGSYVATFVANSTGIVPVTRIGDHVYGETADLMQDLDTLFKSTAWDPI